MLLELFPGTNCAEKVSDQDGPGKCLRVFPLLILNIVRILSLKNIQIILNQEYVIHKNNIH